MENKHTAGPWTPIFRSEQAGQIGVYQRVFLGTEFKVATVWQGGAPSMSETKDKESEMIANAHLIAAAPELLQACKWMYEQIKHLQGDISLIGMGQVIEAIQKAEGRE